MMISTLSLSTWRWTSINWSRTEPQNYLNYSSSQLFIKLLKGLNTCINMAFSIETWNQKTYLWMKMMSRLLILGLQEKFDQSLHSQTMFQPDGIEDLKFCYDQQPITPQSTYLQQEPSWRSSICWGLCSLDKMRLTKSIKYVLYWDLQVRLTGLKVINLPLKLVLHFQSLFLHLLKQ